MVVFDSVVVGVLVVVVPTVRIALVIVEFDDVACVIVQLRIKVSLLHEHGVFIASEEFIAFRLPCSSETIAVCDASLAACTALRLDFDYAVCDL